MKTRLIAGISVLTLLFAIHSENAMSRPPGSVTLEWYGHSCFLLTLENGAKILTDPCDTTRIPYQLPGDSIDLVFSTHDHFDHNAVGMVRAGTILRADGNNPVFFGVSQGKPIRDEASTVVDLRGISLPCSTIPSFHDEQGGTLRGANGIIRFIIEGITFVHLGDLGDTLNTEQIEKLKPADVLLIPVGGYYTIDAKAAQKVVEALTPRIVVPMHYKTAVLPEGFPIEGVEPFLKGFTNVERRSSSSLSLRADKLPYELTVIVLKYHGQE